MKQGPGTVKVNGLDIWYRVQGQGPVCLVPSPGWGFSVDCYTRTLTALSDRLTLVFIDSRGCGRSQRPPATTDYRYTDIASDLEGIRRALGIDMVWVLGHSHAGVVAMRYALDYPTAVAGLLLIGTYAESDAAHDEEVARRKALRHKEPWFREVDWNSIASDQDLADGLMTALPLYFHDYAKLQVCLPDITASTYKVHPYHGWRDSEKFSVHMLDRLSAIKCPTLLIAGEDDFVCPPMDSRRIQEMVAGSELHLLPECGHFSWLEQPQGFFPLVREFLARHAD